MDDTYTVFGTWDVYARSCPENIFLGTFVGFLDEIALHLADKAEHGLEFRIHRQRVDYEPTDISVDICLGSDSDTWEMNSDELLESMKKMFADRPVNVHASPLRPYSVKLVQHMDYHTRQLRIAKLEEELSLLQAMD